MGLGQTLRCAYHGRKGLPETHGGEGIMARDPRYDILFEPVQDRPGHGQEPILPGAPLQRYGGYRDASPPVAEMRASKGRKRMGRDRVHRTGMRVAPRASDITPFAIELRASGTISDIPALARIAEAMKSRTAALAGIELAYSSPSNGANFYSREVLRWRP